MNWVFLNGVMVPEAEAKVSVFDRSFLLGDGVFETLRAYGGRYFRWADHLGRWRRGAELLGIRLPYSDAEFLAAASDLLTRNGLQDAILRLHLSRGVGTRGYSTRGANTPTVMMAVFPSPAVRTDGPVGWNLVVSRFPAPIAGDPLAEVKSASKALNILAKAEAESRGADEALCLNAEGRVVEGAASNLFWLEGGTVCTPGAATGALPGVTRRVALELLAELGVPTREALATPEALQAADGVFLTLSSLGIVEGVSLDGHSLSSSPVVRTLWQRYEAATRDSQA